MLLFGHPAMTSWSHDAIPATGNFHGRPVLGYQTADSENLDLDNPLATGFSLRDSFAHIVCPTVSPGNNYIVVLFGNSGNASAQFTISSVDENLDSSPQFLAIVSTVAPAPSSDSTSTTRSPAVSSSAHGPSPSLLSTLPLTPSSSYSVPSSALSASSSASSPSPSLGSSSLTSASPTLPTTNTNRNGAFSRSLNAAALGSTCAGVTIL
ncbi:hypothetical protein V8E53_014561 [Lactarius tabidus]